MALLVALGNLDGFVDTTVAQRSRHSGGECTRLFASRAIGHPAIDHHADRPTGHDEENDDHGSCDPSHCLPQAQRVGRDGAAAFLDHPGGRDVNVTEKCCCYVSCEHELLFPPRNSLTYLDTVMRFLVPTAHERIQFPGGFRRFTHGATGHTLVKTKDPTAAPGFSRSPSRPPRFRWEGEGRAHYCQSLETAPRWRV